MSVLGFLVYKDNDGLFGFRRTLAEAEEFKASLEDIDPNGEFIIKEWTNEWTY